MASVHKVLVVLMLLSLVVGCWQTDASIRLVGNYKLISRDVQKQWGLYYSLPDGNAVGRIHARIVAVGWSQAYIIAKQRPIENSSITNFYILNMAIDDGYTDPSKCVIGPLTAEQFRAMRSALHIPDSVSFNLTL